MQPDVTESIESTKNPKGFAWCARTAPARSRQYAHESAEPTRSAPSLLWLQSWYESQCDGDWEHCFGVRINTVDNPGWRVCVGLSETDMEGLEIVHKLEERSELDGFVFGDCFNPCANVTQALFATW